jgi:hypothetical protein
MLMLYGSNYQKIKLVQSDLSSRHQNKINSSEGKKMKQSLACLFLVAHLLYDFLFKHDTA